MRRLGRYLLSPFVHFNVFGLELGSYPPRLRPLLADGGAVGRSVLFGGMGPPECSENNDAGDKALT